MHLCLSTTSFVVLINGGPSLFLKAFRGLRQGDPLSLLLFVIVMEVLSDLLVKVKDLKLLRGVTVGRGDSMVEMSNLFFLLMTH